MNTPARRGYVADAFAMFDTVRATHGHRHRPFHYSAAERFNATYTACGMLPTSDCAAVDQHAPGLRPCARCLASVWAWAQWLKQRREDFEREMASRRRSWADAEFPGRG